MESAKNEGTLPSGAKYTYMELRRPPTGFILRTMVKPHLSLVVSPLETGACGWRRDTISCMFFPSSPQNCSTPVPPELYFPWTNGIRILLDRLRDRNVSGNEAGD